MVYNVLVHILPDAELFLGVNAIYFNLSCNIPHHPIPSEYRMATVHNKVI